MVTLTGEIINGKLHFLCKEMGQLRTLSLDQSEPITSAALLKSCYIDIISDQRTEGDWIIL